MTDQITASPTSTQVANWSLLALTKTTAVPEPVTIQPDANGAVRLRLQCLHGADAILVQISCAGEVRLRSEVQARAGEIVPIDLMIGTGGSPVIEAGSHGVRMLPLDQAYAPINLVPVRASTAPWQIGVVIDATVRILSDETMANVDASGNLLPSPFLLEDDERWGKIVEGLQAFVTTLTEARSSFHAAVVAFGDEQPSEGINASDLIPSMHLLRLPEGVHRWSLERMDTEQLTDLLLNDLEATTGGDFVDALADALSECTKLDWGTDDEDAHRLVVIVGDSPGHSTLEPVLNGDALVRSHDVDIEVRELCRLGVEVMTLYLPTDIAKRPKGVPGQLLKAAEAQYTRLASTDQLAFRLPDFDPVKAATVLLERTQPLGRGAAVGLLVAEQPKD